MVDELIYSELAKSFAESGHFLVRDQATAAYGFVYPMLIAPAWALFDAVPQAYAAAKAINALVMSLAAVPAYFLARRVLSPWLSLVAAALTVAIPSMVYTATLMTENAFYPLFLAAALALVLWLERPTALRTARRARRLSRRVPHAPAGARAPARAPDRAAPRRRAGGAPSLRAHVRARRGRRGRRLVVQVARGASPLGVFGAYEVAGRAALLGRARWRSGSSTTSPSSTSRSACCRSPRCSCSRSRGGRSPQRDRIFVAATVSLSFWLVLEVATFASEQTFRVEERNMFYVAPLFLIALLVWIERGLPRPQPAAVLAAGVAAALPLVVPYEDFIGLNAVSDTAALLPLGWLVERGLALGNVDLVVLAGCVVAGARLPVRAAPVRARAAAARPRVLRGLAASDRRRAPLPVGAAPVRRHHEPRTATGSTARSGANADVGARLDRATPTSSRSGRTSSSTAASARSTRRARRCPAASHRRR